MLSTFQAFRRYGQLLTHYLAPHRWRIIALCAILVVTIAIQIATPFVTGAFIDRAVENRALRDLMILALLAIVLALAGQIVATIETWVAEFVSWEATNALRADLARHLLKLDASFHNAHTPGELIERVDGDVATLARFFSRFVVYILGSILLVVGVLGLLWTIDWRIGLGLGAFVCTGLIAVLRIRAIATPYSAIQRQATADFYGFLGEYLAGLEDVRSSGATAYVMRRCAEMMRRWWIALRRAEMWGYGMVATSWGMFGLGTAAALTISAALYRDNTITIGMVFLTFRYSQMLRQPIEQIRNEIQDLQQADASIGRIQQLLAIQPTLIDGSDSLPPGPLSLELDNIWFAYTEDNPVLRGVTLNLAPGHVLGVVGRTGSGKSTLIKLLPRFHDPQRGIVRLGGVDLRTVRLAALRDRIGLVTQEAHLFQASVRDNLTLFDASILDTRIHDALNRLGLESWLKNLPDGLSTRLGPGGLGLSAGQAQVLACARLMLKNPDLVILDEASSRLDPATERLVHDALATLLEGRTAVIVAHRLDTVAFANQILVLDDGQVLEYGPRLELVQNPDSHFARLLRVANGEVLA